MSMLTVGEPRRSVAASQAAPALPAGVPAGVPQRAPGRPAPRRQPDRPPLRLVEPSPRRRVRVGLVGTLCLGAVFVGLFALAAMHSLVVQAQFELERVDQQVAERRSQIEALEVEAARLESPAAVVQAARELGMVQPTDRVHLVPEVGPDVAPGPAPVVEERADDGGTIERADGTPTGP